MRILPLNGNTAWYSLDLPCFAEPPAESPSTKNNSDLADAIRIVKANLDGKGRILIRKSGTESLIRVMVECSDLVLATESANYLAEIIELK